MDTNNGGKLTIGGGLGGGLLSHIAPHNHFLTIHVNNDYVNTAICAVIGAVVGFIVHEAMVYLKAKYFKS